MPNPRIVILAFTLFVAGAGPVRADVVHVAVGDNVRARTRLIGEVLDYTGQELTIRLSTGIERTFPADRVFLVETDRSAAHRAADELFEERKFSEALNRYLEAHAGEPRGWVRRQLLARIVWCLRNLDRLAEAGQYFLMLCHDDPHTPYFDCIPLSWVPAEPPENLRRKSQQWLAAGSPLETLLGASHLMATAERPEALRRLSTLRFHNDRRIAALAKAQHWRSELAIATDARLREWAEAIESMPTDLRAGAWFLLGQARARAERPEQAALAYLRVPILYPRERTLAARCLVEAAGQLEKIGQPQEAMRLYREVLDTLPDSPSVSEARARLRELQK